jgi:hypothetical protein
LRKRGGAEKEEGPHLGQRPELLDAELAGRAADEPEPSDDGPFCLGRGRDEDEEVGWAGECLSRGRVEEVGAIRQLLTVGSSSSSTGREGAEVRAVSG